MPAALPERFRLTADPAEVLKRLPSMGKLMILTSLPGVTHERIGKVETVTSAGGYSVQTGAEHDSRIELGAIADMIIDRTGVMGDKIFPRIDFMQADGTALFGVVGFEGLEPFDKGLIGLPSEDAPAKTETPPFVKGVEADENDLAARAFQRALDIGAGVSIRIIRPGFEQVWTGRVEAIKPSMGFVNVMRPDFHLHVKAGAVASWKGEGGVLVATNAEGESLGLSIEGLEGDIA